MSLESVTSRAYASPLSRPSDAMQWFLSVAYALSVGAALVSGVLTAVYVANGARELNPIVGSLLTHVGPVLTVVLRVGVVIGCFWAYALVSHLVWSAEYWSAFVWTGAILLVVDALHDVGVVVRAGLVAPTLSSAELAWVWPAAVLTAVVAAILRPRLPSAPGWA